jgi:predicted transposase YdaD
MRESAYYQMILAEGREEGRDEGRDEGRLEEVQDLIQKFGIKQLGKLPKKIEQRSLPSQIKSGLKEC